MCDFAPTWCEKYSVDLQGKSGHKYSQTLFELLRKWGSGSNVASDFVRDVAFKTSEILPKKLAPLGWNMATPEPKRHKAHHP